MEVIKPTHSYYLRERKGREVYSSYIIIQDSQLYRLPYEVMLHLFKYLDYQTVATLRLVSTDLNSLCNEYLNTAFQDLVKLSLDRFSKLQLRGLCCYICRSWQEFRKNINRLVKTFTRRIKNSHCSFYMGEILDISYRILQRIKVCPYKRCSLTLKKEIPNVKIHFVDCVAWNHHSVCQDLLEDMDVLVKFAINHFHNYIEPDLPAYRRFVESPMNKRKRKQCHQKNIRSKTVKLLEPKEVVD